MYTNVYIYMCTNIHIHTCTCIYVYTYICVRLDTNWTRVLAVFFSVQHLGQKVVPSPMWV